MALRRRLSSTVMPGRSPPRVMCRDIAGTSRPLPIQVLTVHVRLARRQRQAVVRAGPALHDAAGGGAAGAGGGVGFGRHRHLFPFCSPNFES